MGMILLFSGIVTKVIVPFKSINSGEFIVGN